MVRGPWGEMAKMALPQWWREPDVLECEADYTAAQARLADTKMVLAKAMADFADNANEIAARHRAQVGCIRSYNRRFLVEDPETKALAKYLLGPIKVEAIQWREMYLEARDRGLLRSRRWANGDGVELFVVGLERAVYPDPNLCDRLFSAVGKRELPDHRQALYWVTLHCQLDGKEVMRAVLRDVPELGEAWVRAFKDERPGRLCDNVTVSEKERELAVALLKRSQYLQPGKDKGLDVAPSPDPWARYWMAHGKMQVSEAA